MPLAQALTLGSTVLAAAGEADASRVHGLSRWLVYLHNDHRVLYAVVTVAMLLASGAALGLATEFLLALAGRETERLDVTE